MALSSDKISTTLVANALGHATHKVSELCKSDKINPCSLWKPIDVSTVQLTLPQIEAASCGYTIPLANIDNQVSITNFLTSKGQWTYNKPTKGCRIGDFRNYNHNAVYFTHIYKSTGNIEIKDDGSGVVSAQFNVSRLTDTEVWLKNMPALQDFYFGMMLWKKDNGAWIDQDRYIIMSQYPIWDKTVGQINAQGTSIIVHMEDTPFRVNDTIYSLVGLFNRKDHYWGSTIIYGLNQPRLDSLWNLIYSEHKLIRYIPPYVKKWEFTWSIDATVNGYTFDVEFMSVMVTIKSLGNYALNGQCSMYVQSPNADNGMWSSQTNIGYFAASTSPNSTKTYRMIMTSSTPVSFNNSKFGVINVYLKNGGDTINQGSIQVRENSYEYHFNLNNN